MESPGEKWQNIDTALTQGRRGLHGGSSLAKLLEKKRGVRNHMALPKLTIKQILQWADAHHQKTGKWPKSKSGEVLAAPGEKWNSIQNALFRGCRGLPGGSSLAQLLAEKRGVRNEKSLPDLTIKQILQWADAHYERTGQWPKVTTGDVLDAPSETWAIIAGALFKGRRGLPGGSSLPKLLEKKRGVRNHMALPKLTIKQILQWADAYHERTGQWPKVTTGDVLDAPSETWATIAGALYEGLRGLPSGSSLAKLLAEKRPAK